VNFNIAITGVPGSGKTTISKELERKGFKIIDLNAYSEKVNCTKGDEVDVDCLMKEFRGNEGFLFDGHFSHLLPIYGAIIMKCSPEVLLLRLQERHYSREKIEENMDCLLMDCIYSECIDRLPYNRIEVIDTEKSDIKDSVYKAMSFIHRMEERHNGT
jgi:adenylate kinase